MNTRESHLWLIICNIKKTFKTVPKSRTQETHRNGEEDEDDNTEALQAAPTQPHPGPGPQVGDDEHDSPTGTFSTTAFGDKPEFTGQLFGH